MVDAFPSGKAAGSFREGSLLEESLSVTILGAVGILEPEPTLFFSLSPEKDEDIVSEEGFLIAEAVEILLEEHLAMQ